MRKNFISNDAVFFITGCSSGFGRAMAEYVAKSGFNLVATARNVDSLSFLAPYKNVLCVELDVTKIDTIKSAVAAAVARFGKIDILINNAGINYITDIENMEQDKMRALFETNIIGQINTTREILPYIPDNKKSAVVNVSSMSGLETGYGTILYGISKHAVNGLTQGLRNTSHCKFRAMSVNPGKYATDIRKNSLENPGLDKEEILKSYHSQYLGDVEIAAQDIINAIARDKELPLYMVLGHKAMKRYKKLIREMRGDLKYLQKLPTNREKENPIRRLLRHIRKRKF
ncbi:MAG: SDR family NAD(P)-dependent oxidoreductase [Alphaproteobacteria bacterium]|nr:SDR family NAD(P)-dependent oxidoreductase [Alphaproteobacteria bacterium]